MPKRKRGANAGRSRKRRKTFGKPFTRRRSRRSFIPRGMRSQRKLVKLRYCTEETLNATTGTVARHFYRANGIWDPDETGTGHQPMYRDEIANMYNHYVVLGSKITVRISAFANESTGPSVCGIFLSDDTTTSNVLTTLMEQNRSNWRMVPASSEVRPTTVKKTFSAKKFFNVKDVKDNLDRLGGSIGAKPSEECHYCVYQGAIASTADPSTYHMMVMIDYIVAFSEPKELGAS